MLAQGPNWVNDCHDDFFAGNIKICLHFLSFLKTEPMLTQVTDAYVRHQGEMS